jgi:hypothetical protein
MTQNRIYLIVLLRMEICLQSLSETNTGLIVLSVYSKGASGLLELAPLLRNTFHTL